MMMMMMLIVEMLKFFENAWQVSKTKMKGRKELWKVERNSLVTKEMKIKDKSKKIKLLNTNQSHINDYFMLK